MIEEKIVAIFNKLALNVSTNPIHTKFPNNHLYHFQQYQLLMQPLMMIRNKINQQPINSLQSPLPTTVHPHMNSQALTFRLIT
jgi:hypothetical protein